MRVKCIERKRSKMTAAVHDKNKLKIYNYITSSRNRK